MKKKITCILICLLLIGSVIVGAGISKIEETEITDGTISVKILLVHMKLKALSLEMKFQLRTLVIY